MNRLTDFIKNHKHLYWLLLLIPILVWFKVLEATLVPKYFIHSIWDDRIPFVPAMVIPYVLWFPYIAYALIYTGLNSKKDFYKLMIFLAGGMSAAYLVYMIFPNAQNLRPMVTGTDPFSLLVKFIFATDTSTNVCPSVHVINSIAVHAALAHSEAFSKIKYGRTASGILAVLICASTVMIKQHSIVDVMWGLVFSAFFYFPLYRTELKLELERVVAQRSE